MSLIPSSHLHRFDSEIATIERNTGPSRSKKERDNTGNNVDICGQRTIARRNNVRCGRPGLANRMQSPSLIPGDDTAILIQPLSPEDRLASAYTQYFLARLHLETVDSLWIIPSRLGNSKPVDLATKALARVAFSSFKPDIGCFRLYHDAICALRDALSTGPSDDILLAVNLISTFDHMTAEAPVYLHDAGISAVLLSLPPDTVPSEPSRAVVYDLTRITFERPIMNGIPSPFDAPVWSDLDPGSRLSEVAVVRKMAHRLLLRLPRLVAAMRRVRETPRNTDAQICAARLAGELLAIVDVAAENDLLQHIHASRSREKVWDNSGHTYYFRMVLDALVYYWQARVLLLRICVRLNASFPTSHILCDRSAAICEIVRTCRNIISSSAYLEELPLTAYLLSYAVVGVWGSAVSDGLFCSSVAEEARQWALSWARRMFNLDVQGLEQELDRLADLCTGGPILDRRRSRSVAEQKSSHSPLVSSVPRAYALLSGDILRGERN